MNNSHTVESLNDLLTKAYDAEEGFKQASERSEDHPGLKAFFDRQSDMRRSFGHEIKQSISRHGGTPDKGSSVAAKAHQVWITMKDCLTTDNDGEAILEECIRGEEFALAEYDRKLEDHDLPADVKELISSHRAKVAESLRTVKAKESAVD